MNLLKNEKLFDISFFTGFTGYKVLLEYKKDFMQIYLDITSPTTVSLKLELEAWVSIILALWVK